MDARKFLEKQKETAVGSFRDCLDELLKVLPSWEALELCATCGTLIIGSGFESGTFVNGAFCPHENSKRYCSEHCSEQVGEE